MAIKVMQNLVSSDKYGIKCPYKMDAEYITFHNTYNDATAENEIAYMIRNNNEVSYHFAIDDKEVVQGIPVDRNAWACGDGGNGTGNRKSISVEVCYSKSGGEKYKNAEELAIKFIAQLLHERDWDVDRVKKHEDWSGKHCPHRVLDEGRWDDVKDAIQTELDKLNGVKKETPKPKKVKSTTTTKETSVVDYMNSKGMDSSYPSRAKLAKEYGIKGYSGTASQNIELLKKLQNGLPKKENKPTKQGDMKTNSIVTYLNSVGIDSSFGNREKLAKQYGISGYKGTASQNLKLLDLVRGGKKPTPKKETKSSGIKSIGKIQIVNVSTAALIMDRPDRDNAKSVGTIKKYAKIDISGSVRGKNNPNGYWEIIHEGHRRYVSGQFGKQI